MPAGTSYYVEFNPYHVYFHDQAFVVRRWVYINGKLFDFIVVFFSVASGSSDGYPRSGWGVLWRGHAHRGG